jgi:hypothetical protein
LKGWYRCYTSQGFVQLKTILPYMCICNLYKAQQQNSTHLFVVVFSLIYQRVWVAQWFRSLHYITAHTSLSPVRRGFEPDLVNYTKGALDSQPQMIMLTSCLPIIGGFLRLLRLLSPLKLVAIILLSCCWKCRSANKSNQIKSKFQFTSLFNLKNIVIAVLMYS